MTIWKKVPFKKRDTTRYEEFMLKANAANEKAITYSKQHEPELACFYNNASKEYERRAKNLNIEKASEVAE